MSNVEVMVNVDASDLLYKIHDKDPDEVSRFVAIYGSTEFVEHVVEQSKDDYEVSLLMSRQEARHLLGRLDEFRAALERVAERGDDEQDWKPPATNHPTPART